ncbi:hypothetical protein [Thiorhodococcus minor]|uniref:Uncharacterized protein n=1 Tax=Thiorhodococcus minor TaxID=57489 RepID=A0A6M0K6I3_9GAMM|nr:hypothetical protein [Thiorhodococcus minor]NEV63945.1 hypothetical protein [Thiorhodococcus minor]
MQQIKKTDEHIIFQKKSGRYAVKTKKAKQWVNGEEKQAILVAEQLITLPDPKAAPAEAEPEAEAAAE